MMGDRQMSLHTPPTLRVGVRATHCSKLCTTIPIIIQVAYQVPEVLPGTHMPMKDERSKRSKMTMILLNPINIICIDILLHAFSQQAIIWVLSWLHSCYVFSFEQAYWKGPRQLSIPLLLFSCPFLLWFWWKNGMWLAKLQNLFLRSPWYYIMMHKSAQHTASTTDYVWKTSTVPGTMDTYAVHYFLLFCTVYRLCAGTTYK